MSSDARITLSALLSSTALRLSALVAAAMSAGYLWRAAVEPGATGTGVTGAQAGAQAQPPEISFDTLDLLRSAPPEAAPARADEVAGPTATPKPHPGSSVQLVSVTISGPQPGTAPPAPVRRPTHPVRTKPKPNPPKRGRKPRPKPAPPPRRNPPPPPAPQPPPPAPKPAPPPPPPVAPPAPPPPPPPVGGGETRPGRGRGDRNHRHTGPPGQQKPKQAKGGQDTSGSQGQGGSSGGQSGGQGNGRGKGKG